ncbi:serine hydrolase [Nonomuraea sp. SYSU D8015]|uniref:serine hydrolase n=1 Tax=Nonomuraea sp. SYSU D8015 TaxID=2593644 RepID=UPI0016611343|nr:serine hydrolase domain-containing protein [Nonomuraea sp. SYSU D8015]
MRRNGPHRRAPTPSACPPPVVIQLDPDAPIPPINPTALQQPIAGLPAAEATAAIVRVSGAKGSWKGVTGVADLTTQRKASAHVRFRAGSVTKMFTTAVVLQLVAERKVSLDGTVQDHLPGLLPGTSPRVRGPHHKGYQVVPAGFESAIPYGEGHVVDMTETSVTSTWASGDLVSTVADLEKFVKALFSGKAVPPGGIVAYGKTGARHGYAAGVGATRDLSRTLVYSVNSTDAKASGQNQRTLGIALAVSAR